jgi:hypothetical protein
MPKEGYATDLDENQYIRIPGRKAFGADVVAPILKRGAGQRGAPRVQREILAHLQLHSVDLGEAPHCRAVIVDGIPLDLTQSSHLGLKVPNPLEARVELVVIRDQDASETISTTPARVASDGLSPVSDPLCSADGGQAWAGCRSSLPRRRLSVGRDLIVLPARCSARRRS